MSDANHQSFLISKRIFDLGKREIIKTSESRKKTHIQALYDTKDRCKSILRVGRTPPSSTLLSLLSIS